MSRVKPPLSAVGHGASRGPSRGAPLESRLYEVIFVGGAHLFGGGLGFIRVLSGLRRVLGWGFWADLFRIGTLSDA